jgi:hypothetical protein
MVDFKICQTFARGGDVAIQGNLHVRRLEVGRGFELEFFDRVLHVFVFVVKQLPFLVHKSELIHIVLLLDSKRIQELDVLTPSFLRLAQLLLHHHDFRISFADFFLR